MSLEQVRACPTVHLRYTIAQRLSHLWRWFMTLMEHFRTYTSSLRVLQNLLEDRLTYFLFLDDSAPYQCHACQCLRDSVGGNARDAEIQHDTFFILPPIDPINEILPTRPQDMDRAHGRSSHWHRSQYFSHFWLGYGRSIYSSLSLLTILFVPFILLYTHGSSAMGRFLRSPGLVLQRDQGFTIFSPFPSIIF